MKDIIIEKIREKKNKDGSEVFFLLCADASHLSTQFKRVFNTMLRHFEAIEKLQNDIEERQQKTKEAYADLTLNPNFAEATAQLIAEKNKREHIQRQEQQEQQKDKDAEDVKAKTMEEVNKTPSVITQQTPPPNLQYRNKNS